MRTNFILATVVAVALGLGAWMLFAPRGSPTPWSRAALIVARGDGALEVVAPESLTAEEQRRGAAADGRRVRGVVAVHRLPGSGFRSKVRSSLIGVSRGRFLSPDELREMLAKSPRALSPAIGALPVEQDPAGASNMSGEELVRLLRVTTVQ